MPLPTVLWDHDVQANETEVARVGDGGNAADGLAVQQSDEKTGRVSAKKGVSVLETWIPAFARGQLHSKVNLGPRHPPDDEAIFGEGGQHVDSPSVPPIPGGTGVILVGNLNDCSHAHPPGTQKCS